VESANRPVNVKLERAVWTPEKVYARIEEAVVTSRQTPSARIGPLGFRTAMPQPILDATHARTDYGDPGYEDAYIRIDPDRDAIPAALGAATGRAIDEAQEVEAWLQWVSKRERKLLWVMAANLPRHELEGRFRCSKWTLSRRKARALEKIVRILNKT